MDSKGESSGLQPDRSLDASGTLCPEPVLRASAALREMAAGEVLEVIATDPHAELDFEVFCVRSGHRLLEVEVDGGQLRFLLSCRDQSASAEP